jgi:hypothetical protein
MFWPEGLFPCCTPAGKIFCPLHKLNDWWTVQDLRNQEKLWLFQMPLAMDLLLYGFNPSGRILFADLLSPEVYTSIFFQLWGVYGGGHEFGKFGCHLGHFQVPYYGDSRDG